MTIKQDYFLLYINKNLFKIRILTSIHIILCFIFLIPVCVISIMNLKSYIEYKNLELDKDTKKFNNENSSKLKTADTSEFHLPLLNHEAKRV